MTRPASLDQELTVKPGANRLEFQYAGLSFVAPQKVQYRYQLQGFDHGWIEAGSRRAAFYTNLPPGSYRFQVLAANNDGVWKPTGASFGLRLLPHFYQTWWFYSALVLACCCWDTWSIAGACCQVEAQWGAVLARAGTAGAGDSRHPGPGLCRHLGAAGAGGSPAAGLPGGGGLFEPVFEQLDQARALVRASLAEARTSIWDLRSEAGAPPG
jgi:hypothetical protein